MSLNAEVFTVCAVDSHADPGPREDWLIVPTGVFFPEGRDPENQAPPLLTQERPLSANAEADGSLSRGEHGAEGVSFRGHL